MLAKNKWAAEKKSCCGIKTRGDILLVYRRPMGFYILILYPVTFLNSINLRDSFDQFSCILDWESYHFQIVIFFFPLYIPTFFFPPLNWLAKTLGVEWTHGHVCLIFDFNGSDLSVLLNKKIESIINHILEIEFFLLEIMVGSRVILRHSAESPCTLFPVSTSCNSLQNESTVSQPRYWHWYNLLLYPNFPSFTCTPVCVYMCVF